MVPDGFGGRCHTLAAGLMVIADVYGAPISRRVYKEGQLHARAEKIIVDGKGKLFDPEVADAFLALKDVFQHIAAWFADSNSELQKKAHWLNKDYASVALKGILIHSTASFPPRYASPASKTTKSCY